MDILTLIMSAFITIFSLGLLMVSVASYRKYKNGKLVFISLVFVLFLIKGVLLSISLFVPEHTVVPTGFNGMLFDLIILILLFLATLKR